MHLLSDFSPTKDINLLEFRVSGLDIRLNSVNQINSNHEGHNPTLLTGVELEKSVAVNFFPFK